MEYKQKGKLFEFDLLQCLRTDYYHNDCKECLEICPHEAFFFDRKRLTVDFDKCTNCAVCVGVCPTEALQVEYFSPDDYLLKNPDLLSCKKDIPCLSAFGTEHFITMALRGEELGVDLSHCEGCDLNPENRTLKSIEARIEEAQRFLDEIGSQKEIRQKVYEPNRRGFFKSVFATAQKITNEESLRDAKSGVSRVPLKTTLLKNSLKMVVSKLSTTTISTDYSFLANKAIEDSCTNCGDCVQFCPTDALFFSQDGASIWFVAGKCIDCAICNDICKPKSIQDKERIDLVAYAFDRGEELIHHQIEICQECKTPFPYKGEELICDRCKSFVDDFADIFKMASDME